MGMIIYNTLGIVIISVLIIILCASSSGKQCCRSRVTKPAIVNLRQGYPLVSRTFLLPVNIIRGGCLTSRIIILMERDRPGQHVLKPVVVANADEFYLLLWVAAEGGPGILSHSFRLNRARRARCLRRQQRGGSPSPVRARSSRALRVALFRRRGVGGRPYRHRELLSRVRTPPQSPGPRLASRRAVQRRAAAQAVPGAAGLPGSRRPLLPRLLPPPERWAAARGPRRGRILSQPRTAPRSLPPSIRSLCRRSQ